jgi:hypothetical protein
MKLALFLLLVAMIGNINAGPIKQMATDNPDQILQIITTGTYAVVLQLVTDAYNESKAENDEAITKHVYTVALDQASLDKQIPLAVDFSLAQGDFDLKQMGARAIWRALLQGANPDATLRQRAIAKLKSELQALSAPGRAAFEFATQARDALAVLGDDAGLNLFLTSSQNASNYRQKDGWNPTSDASVFQALKTQYEQAAGQPSNENPDLDRIMAAMYELCRARRTQGKEIKPLQPIANLDNLLPR